MGDNNFATSFSTLSDEVHRTAIEKGFWENTVSTGEFIALTHSELSEALEAARKGNPTDKHLPEYDSLTVELADVVIRIMDYSAAMCLNVGGAIVAKSEFNKTRPYKHGKAF